MVTSVFFAICFLTLLFGGDKSVRAISVFGLTHLALENIMLLFFTRHPWLFDFYLYLTAGFILDITLMFSSACVMVGLKRKLYFAMSIPLIACQMILLQAPFMSELLFSFTFNDAYLYFMEVFILCARLRQHTRLDYIRTTIILACICAVHLV